MTVLAFDYGSQKVGIAIGNIISGTARELTTLPTPQAGKWEDFDKVFDEWQPEAIVVGLPLDSDGSEQPMSKAARSFASELIQRYECHVELVDERFTSHAARSRLRSARASGARPRRLRRGDVDAAAAVLLLEDWLNA